MNNLNSSSNYKLEDHLRSSNQKTNVLNQFKKNNNNFKLDRIQIQIHCLRHQDYQTKKMIVTS